MKPKQPLCLALDLRNQDRVCQPKTKIDIREGLDSTYSMYEESYKILCPDWAIYILKSAGKVYSTPKEKPCETDETVHTVMGRWHPNLYVGSLFVVGSIFVGQIRITYAPSSCPHKEKIHTSTIGHMSLDRG